MRPKAGNSLLLNEQRGLRNEELGQPRLFIPQFLFFILHFIFYKMPYELQELAAISGMPGLYRLVRAARHGVLVESLDEKATRTLAPARNKVSLLSEISIYTQDPDQTVPLTEAFERIHRQHGGTAPVTAKSSEGELTSFMAGVIPDYDRDRVYLSDIKKLATWFGIVSKHVPYQEAAAEAAAPASEEEAPKPKRKAAKTETEEATDAPAADAEAAPAKKTRKSAE